MKLNTCYYSAGSKHDCCTHQHYCIFNEKRTLLEKKITELENEYAKWKKLRDSYMLGNYCPIEYNTIILQLDVIKQSMNELNNYKNKILNGEIDGYGYEILESEKL